MIEFIKVIELDNLLCVVLLGAIAITSLFTTSTEVTLASSVASDLIGDLAKSAIND